MEMHTKQTFCTMLSGEHNSIATLMLGYRHRLEAIKAKDIISDVAWNLLVDTDLRSKVCDRTDALRNRGALKASDEICKWAASVDATKLRLCLDVDCSVIPAAVSIAAKKIPDKEWYLRISNSNAANDLSFFLGNDHDSLPKNMHVRVHIESGTELYLGCFKQLTYSKSASSIREENFFPGAEEDPTLCPVMYLFR